MTPAVLWSLYLDPCVLSYLADAVCQLAVDDQRSRVYLRTERSNLAVFALSEVGSAKRIASLSESQVVSAAAGAARMVDRAQFRGIVHLAPLASPSVHLLAVTAAGVRLYFGPGLRLLHVRVPPAGGTPAPQLGEVRLAAESRGTVLLLSSGESSDSYAAKPLSKIRAF